jgi:antitoxin component YwqK of YwqJK toxin-antitoxin module
MTRDQHLEFCKRCLNRKFDGAQGLICGITNRMANFDPTCENFKIDESVKIEAPEVVPVPNYKIVTELSDGARAHFRDQQDSVYAIIGGAASAIVGGLLWALVTVMTHYQIGYMAIAVGLIVGFSVRYYGAGVDLHFGYIGGFFALLGCAIGNLLSQVAFIAQTESLGYFETITLLNIDIILSIITDSFSPMDILFYGIAAFEGYKFAFRNISDDLIKSVAEGKLKQPPFAHLRLPTVIILFLLLSVGAYFVSRGSVGIKTFYYESGSKRTMGELVYGKENGPWESWWENGNLQSQGFFIDGKADSTWKYYDENGTLARQANFMNDLQHGPWIEYYPSGAVSGKGLNHNGRLQGECTYFYESGKISQKGYYHLDMPDSTWEMYYENGTLGSKGSYKRAIQTGPWKYWNEEGTLFQELLYTHDGTMTVINTWSHKGKPEVVNGEGIFKRVYLDGTVIETGMVKKSKLSGRWKKYFPNGLLQEEGEFKDGIYYMVNAFTAEGNQIVREGEGAFNNVPDDSGMSLTSGSITNGLRSGKWEITSAMSDVVVQVINFVDGKLEGPQFNYFDTGELYNEGNCKNNKHEGVWTWYHQNGEVESVANFVAGLKEGEQFFYDEDGVLLRSEFYKNGELVKVSIPE